MTSLPAGRFQNEHMLLWIEAVFVATTFWRLDDDLEKLVSGFCRSGWTFFRLLRKA